ncbi:MAG: hypothetical protein OEZ02_14435, partial [Anaerolineae bacterium]|nr:hypothetical protein [Anaerolineae bacterium]
KPWTHCLITRVFSIWLTDLTCHHPEIVLNVVETNPPDDWAIERTNAAMEASINTYGQLLSDEVISIDGQPTRVITLLAAGLLATPGDEQIIIHVYYQTQEIGYYFGLSSLEPVELGGEFHHAFLNILAAIKVIPALQE